MERKLQNFDYGRLKNCIDGSGRKEKGLIFFYREIVGIGAIGINFVIALGRHILIGEQNLCLISITHYQNAGEENSSERKNF